MLTCWRRAAGALAATGVAAGLALGGAVPALAAASPSNFVGGPQTSHSGCTVGLMWSRLSASTPADVAAEVTSLNPGHTCTGWVERSATGKTQWSVASAKVALPSVPGLEGVANTGLVYDGPGYKARGCVQAGSASSAVSCTSAVSLAKGSGTATSPAFAASWVNIDTGIAAVIRQNSSTEEVLGECAGALATSTTAKKSATSVFGLLDSEADPCTGWIQTSVNKGKTWTTVSPVVSFRSGSLKTDVLAFTAHYGDGTGRLARLCVKDMVSKQSDCTAGS